MLAQGPAAGGRPGAVWSSLKGGKDCGTLYRMTGHFTTSPRPLLWVLIALAAMLITYAAFRGYLQPEFLLGFANGFTC